MAGYGAVSGLYDRVLERFGYGAEAGLRYRW